MPEFLINLLKQQYNDDEIKRILAGYNCKRKTTLRVNTLKTNVDYIKETLIKNNIKYSLVSWYSDALIIEDDISKIKKLDIYNDGLIYLQSLSSMLPALILNPSLNDRILDMTSAPGGKTTQLASLNSCFITACEKNKIRCDRLKYNILKQGASRITVLNEDARFLDDLYSFDKILLDAPCSGSGTLDNNYNINLSLIENSVKVQMELLEKAVKLLKKDSYMVYSTCSILTKENEEQIKKILNKYNLEVIPILGFDDVPRLNTTISGSLCVCPTDTYEGFFVVKLKKLFKD